MESSPKFQRIVVNPAVLGGQPIIRGTRITVRCLVEAVALYLDRQELKADYPGISDVDIQEALRFAAASTASNQRK